MSWHSDARRTPLAQDARAARQALRSGVRWAVPPWFFTHGKGDQLAAAVVRGRDVTLRVAVVRVELR